VFNDCVHLAIPDFTQLATVSSENNGDEQRYDQDTGLEELSIILVRQCKSKYLFYKK
jgi:hypothetical protein